MKRLAVTAGLLLLLSPSGQAADQSLMRHFESGTEIDAPSSTFRVMRLDIDLTGDGQPELLLALPDRIPWWFVYEKAGDNQYQFRGNLSFMPKYFRVDSDPTRVVVDLPGVNSPGTTRVKRFDGSTFVDCVPQDSPPCKPSTETFDDWRKRVNLRVLVARLDDVEANANPTWTDFLKGGAVSGVGGLLDFVVTTGQ